MDYNNTVWKNIHRVVGSPYLPPMGHDHRIKLNHLTPTLNPYPSTPCTHQPPRHHSSIHRNSTESIHSQISRVNQDKHTGYAGAGHPKMNRTVNWAAVNGPSAPRHGPAIQSDPSCFPSAPFTGRDCRQHIRLPRPVQHVQYPSPVVLADPTVNRPPAPSGLGVYRHTDHGKQSAHYSQFPSSEVLVQRTTHQIPPVAAVHSQIQTQHPSKSSRFRSPRFFDEQISKSPINYREYLLGMLPGRVIDYRSDYRPGYPVGSQSQRYDRANYHRRHKLVEFTQSKDYPPRSTVINHRARYFPRDPVAHGSQPIYTHESFFSQRKGDQAHFLEGSGYGSDQQILKAMNRAESQVYVNEPSIQPTYDCRMKRSGQILRSNSDEAAKLGKNQHPLEQLRQLANTIQSGQPVTNVLPGNPHRKDHIVSHAQSSSKECGDEGLIVRDGHTNNMLLNESTSELNNPFSRTPSLIANSTRSIRIMEGDLARQSNRNNNSKHHTGNQVPFPVRTVSNNNETDSSENRLHTALTPTSAHLSGIQSRSNSKTPAQRHLSNTDNHAERSTATTCSNDPLTSESISVKTFLNEIIIPVALAMPKMDRESRKEYKSVFEIWAEERENVTFNKNPATDFHEGAKVVGIDDDSDQEGVELMATMQSLEENEPRDEDYQTLKPSDTKGENRCGANDSVTLRSSPTSDECTKPSTDESSDQPVSRREWDDELHEDGDKCYGRNASNEQSKKCTSAEIQNFKGACKKYDEANFDYPKRMLSSPELSQEQAQDLTVLQVVDNTVDPSQCCQLDEANHDSAEELSLSHGEQPQYTSGTASTECLDEDDNVKATAPDTKSEETTAKTMTRTELNASKHIRMKKFYNIGNGDEGQSLEIMKRTRSSIRKLSMRIGKERISTKLFRTIRSSSTHPWRKKHFIQPTKNTRRYLPPRPKDLASIGLSVHRTSGETLLHRIVRLNAKECLVYCLGHYLIRDVNAQDNAGFTALHECCNEDRVWMTEQLLTHGADPNIGSQDGTRPLDEAVDNDNIEMVRLLLSYGSDPTHMTDTGTTVLDRAKSQAMKQLLCNYISDINGRASEFSSKSGPTGTSTSVVRFRSSYETQVSGLWNDTFLDATGADGDESWNPIVHQGEHPTLKQFRWQLKEDDRMKNWYFLQDVRSRLSIPVVTSPSLYPYIKVHSLPTGIFLKKIQRDPSTVRLSPHEKYFEHEVVEFVEADENMSAILQLEGWRH